MIGSWLGALALALAVGCAASADTTVAATAQSDAAIEPQPDGVVQASSVTSAPADPRVDPKPQPVPGTSMPPPLDPMKVHERQAPRCPEPPCSAFDGDLIEFTDEDLGRIRIVQPVVAKASSKHGVDPLLVNAVIWIESKFNRRAKGPSGARGLMQLMPKTSRALASKLNLRHAPYDAGFNVEAGTYYLSRLLHRFDGDQRLALAAYSRGWGRVARWVADGQAFPAGTERFIRKVERAKASFAAALAHGLIEIAS